MHTSNDQRRCRLCFPMSTRHDPRGRTEHLLRIPAHPHYIEHARDPKHNGHIRYHAHYQATHGIQMASLNGKTRRPAQYLEPRWRDNSRRHTPSLHHRNNVDPGVSRGRIQPHYREGNGTTFNSVAVFVPAEDPCLHDVPQTHWAPPAVGAARRFGRLRRECHLYHLCQMVSAPSSQSPHHFPSPNRRTAAHRRRQA